MVSLAGFGAHRSSGSDIRLLPRNAGLLWLHCLDAVYVALGTLTTAGSGEIVRALPCVPGTDGGELPVGFALLGLTVTEVSTGVFAALSRPPGSLT
jgi:hypothetical protein